MISHEAQAHIFLPRSTSQPHVQTFRAPYALDMRETYVRFRISTNESSTIAISDIMSGQSDAHVTDTFREKQEQRYGDCVRQLCVVSLPKITLVDERKRKI